MRTVIAVLAAALLPLAANAQSDAESKWFSVLARGVADMASKGELSGDDAVLLIAGYAKLPGGMVFSSPKQLVQNFWEWRRAGGTDARSDRERALMRVASGKITEAQFWTQIEALDGLGMQHYSAVFKDASGVVASRRQSNFQENINVALRMQQESERAARVAEQRRQEQAQAAYAAAVQAEALRREEAAARAERRRYEEDQQAAYAATQARIERMQREAETERIRMEQQLYWQQQELREAQERLEWMQRPR